MALRERSSQIHICRTESSSLKAFPPGSGKYGILTPKKQATSSLEEALPEEKHTGKWPFIGSISQVTILRSPSFERQNGRYIFHIKYPGALFLEYRPFWHFLNCDGAPGGDRVTAPN